MKNLINKNKEQENMIEQYENVLIKSKSELQTVIKDKDRLNKELYELKLHREDSQRKIADELNRITHEKQYMEKKIVDYKETNQQLQY